VNIAPWIHIEARQINAIPSAAFDAFITEVYKDMRVHYLVSDRFRRDLLSTSRRANHGTDAPSDNSTHNTVSD